MPVTKLFKSVSFAYTNRIHVYMYLNYCDTAKVVLLLLQVGTATCTAFHRFLLSRLQAIHVGDSLASDIQGGINAGLAATVWVSPRGAAAPQDGPQPTFTISHVGALLPILEQLSEAHVPSSACAATPEA